MEHRTELVPRGPFSLKAAAQFGFGPNAATQPSFDGAMRLAYPVDGGRGYAGAVLRQPHAGGPISVELRTAADGDLDRALRQIERVLSLDYDGAEFAKVGERDPVIARLQRQHPGQRPVLFHSPYEAAAWAIISARRPARQAARLRAAIGERIGETFELADQTAHAFPQPDRLLHLEPDVGGLSGERLLRLLGVARAALAGELDVELLRELGAEDAYERIQGLRGLGPFYASLVVLRACGFADALLTFAEPRVLAHAGRFYGLGRPATTAEFEAIAERWRPFRTWSTVLVRLAGDRAAAG
jgi:DNA-3-methyladenine glycosylase II